MDSAGCCVDESIICSDHTILKQASVPPTYVKRNCGRIDYLNLEPTGAASRLQTMLCDTCVDSGRVYNIAAADLYRRLALENTASPCQQVHLPWTSPHQSHFSPPQQLGGCSLISYSEGSCYGDKEIAEGYSTSKKIPGTNKCCEHLAPIEEDIEENAENEVEARHMDDDLKVQLCEVTLKNDGVNEITYVTERNARDTSMDLYTDETSNGQGHTVCHERIQLKRSPDFPLLQESLAAEQENHSELTEAHALAEQGSLLNFPQHEGNQSGCGAELHVSSILSPDRVQREMNPMFEKSGKSQQKLDSMTNANVKSDKIVVLRDEEPNMPEEKTTEENSQKQQEKNNLMFSGFHQEDMERVDGLYSERQAKIQHDETEGEIKRSNGALHESGHFSTTCHLYLGGMPQEQIRKETNKTKMGTIESAVDGKPCPFHLGEDGHRMAQKPICSQSLTSSNNHPQSGTRTGDDEMLGATIFVSTSPALSTDKQDASTVSLFRTSNEIEEHKQRILISQNFRSKDRGDCGDQAEPQKATADSIEGKLKPDESVPMEFSLPQIIENQTVDLEIRGTSTEFVLTEGLRKIMPRKPHIQSSIGSDQVLNTNSSRELENTLKMEEEDRFQQTTEQAAREEIENQSCDSEYKMPGGEYHLVSAQDGHTEFFKRPENNWDFDWLNHSTISAQDTSSLQTDAPQIDIIRQLNRKTRMFGLPENSQIVPLEHEASLFGTDLTTNGCDHMTRRPASPASSTPCDKPHPPRLQDVKQAGRVARPMVPVQQCCPTIRARTSPKSGISRSETNEESLVCPANSWRRSWSCSSLLRQTSPKYCVERNDLSSIPFNQKVMNGSSTCSGLANDPPFGLSGRCESSVQQSAKRRDRHKRETIHDKSANSSPVCTYSSHRSKRNQEVKNSEQKSKKQKTRFKTQYVEIERADHFFAIRNQVLGKQLYNKDERNKTTNHTDVRNRNSNKSSGGYLPPTVSFSVKAKAKESVVMQSVRQRRFSYLSRARTSVEHEMKIERRSNQSKKLLETLKKYHDYDVSPQTAPWEGVALPVDLGLNSHLLGENSPPLSDKKQRTQAQGLKPTDPDGVQKRVGLGPASVADNTVRRDKRLSTLSVMDSPQKRNSLVAEVESDEALDIDSEYNALSLVSHNQSSPHTDESNLDTSVQVLEEMDQGLENSSQRADVVMIQITKPSEEVLELPKLKKPKNKNKQKSSFSKKKSIKIENKGKRSRTEDDPALMEHNRTIISPEVPEEFKKSADNRPLEDDMTSSTSNLGDASVEMDNEENVFKFQVKSADDLLQTNAAEKLPEISVGPGSTNDEVRKPYDPPEQVCDACSHVQTKKDFSEVQEILLTCECCGGLKEAEVSPYKWRCDLRRCFPTINAFPYPAEPNISPLSCAYRDMPSSSAATSEDGKRDCAKSANTEKHARAPSQLATEASSQEEGRTVSAPVQKERLHTTSNDDKAKSFQVSNTSSFIKSSKDVEVKLAQMRRSTVSSISDHVKRIRQSNKDYWIALYCKYMLQKGYPCPSTFDKERKWAKKGNSSDFDFPKEAVDVLPEPSKTQTENPEKEEKIEHTVQISSPKNQTESAKKEFATEKEKEQTVHITSSKAQTENPKNEFASENEKEQRLQFTSPNTQTHSPKKELVTEKEKDQTVPTSSPKTETESLKTVESGPCEANEITSTTPLTKTLSPNLTANTEPSKIYYPNTKSQYQLYSRPWLAAKYDHLNTTCMPRWWRYGIYSTMSYPALRGLGYNGSISNPWRAQKRVSFSFDLPSYRENCGDAPSPCTQRGYQSTSVPSAQANHTSCRRCTSAQKEYSPCAKQLKPINMKQSRALKTQLTCSCLKKNRRSSQSGLQDNSWKCSSHHVKVNSKLNRNSLGTQPKKDAPMKVGLNRQKLLDVIRDEPCPWLLSAKRSVVLKNGNQEDKHVPTSKPNSREPNAKLRSRTTALSFVQKREGDARSCAVSNKSRGAKEILADDRPKPISVAHCFPNASENHQTGSFCLRTNEYYDFEPKDLSSLSQGLLGLRRWGCDGDVIPEPRPHILSHIRTQASPFDAQSGCVPLSVNSSSGNKPTRSSRHQHFYSNVANPVHRHCPASDVVYTAPCCSNNLFCGSRLRETYSPSLKDQQQMIHFRRPRPNIFNKACLEAS